MNYKSEFSFTFGTRACHNTLKISHGDTNIILGELYLTFHGRKNRNTQELPAASVRLVNQTVPFLRHWKNPYFTLESNAKASLKFYPIYYLMRNAGSFVKNSVPGKENF